MTEVDKLQANLSNLVLDVTKFFSFIILGTIITHFIQLSTAVYRITLFLEYDQKWQLLDLCEFGSLVFWLVIKILILYFLCAVPESVTDEVRNKKKNEK